MTPVIQRVADGFGKRSGKCLEFLFGIGTSGNQFLRNAAGPHDAPFIMVGTEPEIGNVTETDVVRDFGNRNMTMVINDRHVLGVLVIQHLRALRIQKEVFIHKLHSDILPIQSEILSAVSYHIAESFSRGFPKKNKKMLLKML